MKTKALPLALMAMFLLSGTARLSGQSFSLGGKAGAGLSYFSNFKKSDYYLTRSPNIMVQGGLVGKLMFTKLIGIQFEILYQQNGEKYIRNLAPDLGTRSFEMKLYMNYLTLPILAEFSHSFGNVTLFGGLGPYFGYALNGKFVYDETSSNMEFGKGKFRRFDAGASGDVGVGFKVGRGNIFLDLRYNYGFVDIMQLSDKPEGYMPHCNRNFGICLGYIIPLGKSSK